MNGSLWIDESKGKRFKPLNENTETDVLIIGGGLVGVQTAYLLLAKKAEVTLVEADLIGYGTSGRNTGKLTMQPGIIYSSIKKKYGIEMAKAFYKDSLGAYELIEQIIHNHHIPCHLEKMPTYIFTERLEKMAMIEEEFKVYQEIGIEGELVQKLELPINIKMALSQSFGGGFNPKQYIDGLVSLIEIQGGRIYENTPITGIVKKEASYEVLADKFKISAKKVVICSHYPIDNTYNFYTTRLRPEASYIVAGEDTKDFMHAQFINIDHPVRSFRPYQKGDKKLLLIGGDSHKVGQDMTNHYEELMEYGKSTFEIETYDYKWGAEDYITMDGLPYIGYLNEDKEPLFTATGFNKWGNVNSMVAAKRLADLVLGKDNEKNSLYNQSRTKKHFNASYIVENSNTLYKWIKSKLQREDGTLPEELETATTIKLQGNKYGIYKDKKGELHIVDVTCQHMKAELNFNPIDKTWDCPCHGSRFNYDGEKIEGPAMHNLKKYKYQDIVERIKKRN